MPYGGCLGDGFFGLASCTWVRAYRGLMTTNLGSSDWVPDSCTLPIANRPMRLAEFDAFFADAVQDTDRPARTRLDLLIDTNAESRGRDLAARETGCCSFFTFTFEPAEHCVVMHIDVSAADAGVLDAVASRVGAVSR